LKIFYHKFLRLFLLVAIAFSACGKEKKSPVEPAVTTDTYISEGWTLFEKSPPDYLGSLDEFSHALQIDEDNVEALTGRGWCYAYLAVGPGDIKYSQAVDNFSRAVSLDNDYVDAWAGYALVRFVTNDYSTALTYAITVLTLDSDYVFSHKTDVTADDFQLMKAQIYFYQGTYSDVAAVLDLLEPGVQHPVDQPEVLLQQLQNLWDLIF